jgi:LysR family cys regulon transcriptional activator
MNFQQIRCVVEIVRRNLSVSDAAQSLFTSQPGVSHHVRTLEEELGVPIFVRRGKRLVGLTPTGQEIVAIAERIVLDTENLRRLARASQNQAVGDLVVATTHTQAYHTLPAVIRTFLARHPGIRLSLQPCSPMEAAELVVKGEAHLCLSTEVVGFFPDLVMLPGPRWSRCVITPARHPLLEERRLKLASIARYPLVTYDFAFDRHSKVRDAFEREGLAPRVVLTSTDPGIIKTYVASGLGIGLIGSVAFDPRRDRNLRMLDASHLFESSITTVGIHRNTYMEGWLYEFIELFLPGTARAEVDAAIARANATRTARGTRARAAAA